MPGDRPGGVRLSHIPLVDAPNPRHLLNPGRRRGKQPKGDGTIRHVTPYLLITIIAVLLAIMLVFATPAKAHHTPHPIPGKGDQSWQWKWQVWLPDKWARIGACETGYGRRPGDWTWNSGTYQGAFGFYHGSWDQFKPVSWWPNEAYLASPWQQYQTALAIYRRYGLSGWGCRNA